MATEIRLMSHNVWNCDKNCPNWEEKGEDCSAQARVGGLARTWKEILPDVVGGQEFTPLMCDLLMEDLQAAKLPYTLIWGRFTPIFYRSDKLELLESRFMTYPEAIDGFEGCFNDVRSKSCNIAVFREKQSQKPFVFMTTHLWWMSSNPKSKHYQAGSDEAREQQIATAIAQVNDYAKRYECPAVLVGDLNTNYHSRAIQYALSNGFSHAHDVATEYADETMGYHNCFPWGFDTVYFDQPFEKAIDHILVQGLTVRRFARYSPDYYFPISDHSPVYADVEL